MPLMDVTCRSPHGERGLKSVDGLLGYLHPRSLSSWRAWIEIEKASQGQPSDSVALLMESVD